MASFAQSCVQILQQPCPAQKAMMALALMPPSKQDLKQAAPSIPRHPARPEGLTMVAPGKVMKRKWGSKTGRLALLHAIAHIELNAIDLAFDIMARFAFIPPVCAEWSMEFCCDWLRIGQEEARHFGLLSELLAAHGMQYGDLAVHDGMWNAAVDTADCVLARLAIAPLVLEARGLDVTPPMIEKFKQAGDNKTAEVLQLIFTEEIGHVAVGAKWFKRICEQQNLDSKSHFQHLVKTRYTSTLKPPFNTKARNQAGLPEDFYMQMTE